LQEEKGNISKKRSDQGIRKISARLERMFGDIWGKRERNKQQ
jgi:hypothetical protein